MGALNHSVTTRYLVAGEDVETGATCLLEAVERGEDHAERIAYWRNPAVSYPFHKNVRIVRERVTRTYEEV